MPTRDARLAARTAMIASLRANYGAYGVAAASMNTQIVATQAVMATVSLNTISAQNITDINAALVTAAAQLVIANAATLAAFTALNASMVDTAE